MPMPRLPEEDFAEADTLDVNDPRIVLRPDGYHWLSEGGRIENGPFDSARAAWADMHAADEDAPTAEDDLGEVSAEIGIADWVDPDTGDLAEGTIPHLSEEWRPRSPRPPRQFPAPSVGKPPRPQWVDPFVNPSAHGEP